MPLHRFAFASAPSKVKHSFGTAPRCEATVAATLALEQVRREFERDPHTFVLLPSCDRDVCMAETLRRQIARAFSRSVATEEAVNRERFDIYMSLPLRKIETMRPVGEAVTEILAALSPEKK